MRIIQPIKEVGKTKGFTLVELLVVIFIISLLMSIMMPSLRSSREQACRLDCSSNLRNLTIAWQLYAYDNDDRLCHPDTEWNDSWDDFYWVSDGPVIPGNDTANTMKALKDGVLWSYIQEDEVYKCKQDKSDKIRSYSLSGTMGPTELSGTQATGSMESSAMKQFDPYVTISQIERSSIKMVFIDAQGYNAWLDRCFHVFIDQKNTWAAFNASRNNITERHNHGSNISFSDTHVEHWRWYDTKEEGLTRNQEDMERLYNALTGIRVGYYTGKGI